MEEGEYTYKICVMFKHTWGVNKKHMNGKKNGKNKKMVKYIYI